MASQQLQVVTPQSDVMRGLVTEEAKSLLGQYLNGTDLSVDGLLLDLATMMTLKPALRDCTQVSLFHCLLFAAKNHSTFGPNGVEIIPRGETDEDGKRKQGPKTAMPQLSYRRKAEAVKEQGAYQLQVERVYEGETFKVIRDGGLIVGVDHEPDYTKPRDREGLLLGYGIAVWPDGRRFYHIVTRADVDRAEKASAAKKGGPWKDGSYPKMADKTIVHRTSEALVGDFSKGPGAGGNMLTAPDADGDLLEADYENLDGPVPFSGSDSSAAAADNLLAQAQSTGGDTTNTETPKTEPENRPEQATAGAEPRTATPAAPATPEGTKGQPPVEVPPLPANYEQLTAAPGPYRTLHTALVEAERKLQASPQALCNYWYAGGVQIMDQASEDSRMIMQSFYDHYSAKAAAAGYPQQGPE